MGDPTVMGNPTETGLGNVNPTVTGLANGDPTVTGLSCGNGAW